MNSLVFTVCIVISGLVSVSIVLFYAKKNPNPYFRPKLGELAMMSIFLAIVSGIGSFAFSQLFEADLDLKKIAEQEERRRKEGIRASGNEEPKSNSSSPSGSAYRDPEIDSGTGSGSASGRPDIPPFLEGK